MNRYCALFLAVATLATGTAGQTKTAPVKPAATQPSQPKKATASPTTNQSQKATILKLEHEWALALLKGDADKLDQILADDLQYTRSNGKVASKAEYLEPIRAKTTKYFKVVRSNEKVQIHGETAIVTAVWKTEVQNANNPRIKTEGRYLHVYLKKGGRWIMTTHQSTEFKNNPTPKAQTNSPTQPKATSTKKTEAKTK